MRNVSCKLLFLVIVCAIATLLYSSTASAQYATQGNSRSTTNPSGQFYNATPKSKKPSINSRNNVREHTGCNDQDRLVIKNFSREATQVVAQYHALVEESDKSKTASEARAFSKKFTALTEFYKSEEYKRVEPIFRACGIEIPRPQAKVPFWTPPWLGIDTMNML